VTAHHVVSSAPVNEVMGRLSPAPLSLFHARSLKYRDFLTVVLIGHPREELPDNWVYIHDPSVKVGRVQNFRSWSPDMIPDGVSTCLGLEYFCFEGDGLWTADDDALIELAKAEIGKIGLMRREDVYDACVVRQKKAYPVYDETYADHLAIIRREIGLRYPSLHLVGRNGMHKYNNQDHAMMTGMLTAENIIAGKQVYDTWGVNEDAEYGEAGDSGVEEALKSERLVPKKVAA
jgi:protoporphyrinogen oxidase